MFRFFIPLLVKLGPPGLRRFLLDMAPSVLLQKVKGIVDVMAQTSTDIFREKLAALEQGDEAVMRQVGEGKDVMSILCALSFISHFPPQSMASLLNVYAGNFSEGERVRGQRRTVAR